MSGGAAGTWSSPGLTLGAGSASDSISASTVLPHLAVMLLVADESAGKLRFVANLCVTQP